MVLRACGDCGQLVDVPALDPGARAYCPRCDALLAFVPRGGAALPLVCAAMSGMLLVVALTAELMGIHAFGRFVGTTVSSGLWRLREEGFFALAAVTWLLLFAAPIARVGILIVTLGALRLARPPRWLTRRLARPFAWTAPLGPWAMLDVYLLGVAVAYTRVRAVAHVAIGPSLYALAGVVPTLLASDASLDRDSVWRRLEALAPPSPASLAAADPAATDIACEGCGRVRRAREGDTCPLCRCRLHARRPNALGRAVALLLASALLYAPANLLPVMTIVRFAGGGAHTILGGVRALFDSRLYALAAIVFVASFVVPLLKVIALATMAVMTKRHSRALLRGRTRLFRFVRVIGRWSMIDIFSLATLVGTVQLGVFSSVAAGPGATAFCSVVVLTMLATELFDPRVMWDAAARPA
jgi:paraquat-inducible protein A